MQWNKSNTITGSPAEGAKYLRRPYINNEFWDRIKSGEHILVSAPRRVGKSSIMKDLENTCPGGYISIYNDIESDKTQKDFFKRLFMLLLEKTGTKRRIKKKIGLWLKTKDIGEISTDGKIKFTKRDIDYKEELLNLIKLLGKESVHVVMLLDEFPEVIQNIIRNEGENAAIDTLHTLRSIRHDKKFRNFSFAFAGSIGLNHIVSSLDRQKLINDLQPIYIESLTIPESHKLTTKLLKGATMQIGMKEKNYLFKKIDYLLPYFIQLMIEKCDFILHKMNRPELTVADIDKAFSMVVKEGRNFDDWESRLKRYFDTSDTKYCIAVLTRCAHFESYTIQEAYDLSKKMLPVTGYKQLIDDVLLKDGYIAEEQGSYTFLSPFLREWWKNRHPEFEIEN